MSFPVVFHTENCAVHSGNPTVSSVSFFECKAIICSATCYITVHSVSNSLYNLRHPFLAIHSADEHRMIYSFSNTTSYSTFYVFFSSFRITLWPLWLTNNKRQPFFLSTIVTRTRRHTELTKKVTNLMGNLCCAREHSIQFFVKLFAQLNCTV